MRQLSQKFRDLRLIFSNSIELVGGDRGEGWVCREKGDFAAVSLTSPSDMNDHVEPFTPGKHQTTESH